jgi:acyl-[acyl carrier protein]--UDP-N-acetylglucosamine O-acyltransferase
MARIHATALVDPLAQLDISVSVGRTALDLM